MDFHVERGEVVGLLGQNGSGKSTLVKLLAGINRPEPGATLEVGGRQVSLPLLPATARHLNLAFVHQDLGLARGLTVAENLLVGSAGPSAGLLRWTAERRRLGRMLQTYGVEIDPAGVVDRLPPVEQALIAIIRASEEIKQRSATSGSDHAVIFLDEPTVFLPKEETRFLYDLVRRLAGEGASTVFISHDLAAVRELCHRVVVLRDGSVSGESLTADLNDDELVGLIVGKTVKETPRTRASATADPADSTAPRLTARDLRGSQLRGASLSVAAGEIVGVAGLTGSGADDLPYALFGSLAGASGQVSVDGSEIRFSPRAAMEAGLALVPADRRRDAVAVDLSVMENALLLVLPTFVRASVLSGRLLKQRATELLEEFDVRPRDPAGKVGLLSGGNQQKVVLAKWLEKPPKILLLHEPTQGVDVAARAQIRECVLAATRGGMSVLWSSTDFEELALVCDRVLIISGGQFVSELRAHEITEEAINSAVYQSSVRSSIAVPRQNDPSGQSDWNAHVR